MSIDANWRAFGFSFAILALSLATAHTILAWFPWGAHGVRVYLPAGTEPQALYSEPALTVRMAAERLPDGRYGSVDVWIEREIFPRDVALDRLARLKPGRGARAVLRADARLPFGSVRTVVRALQATGYEHVFLATSRPNGNALGPLSETWRRNHVVE